MKKTLLVGFVAMLMSLSFTANAQNFQFIPDCQNNNVIDGMISSQAAQGWVVDDVAVAVIDYFVQPSPPYASHFVTFILTPDCSDPLEPCPAIAKAINYEVIVINNNGTCIFKKANF